MKDQVALRQQILDEIGDKQHTLTWSKSLAVGWGMGYTYLFWILFMPLMGFISFVPKDYLPLPPLLLAVALGALTGWMIHRKGLRSTITFDAKGFEFCFDGTPYYKARWSDVDNISSNRHSLIITLRTGVPEPVRAPSAQRTRESDQFLALLKTFRDEKERKPLNKKMAFSALAAGIIGILSMAVYGRPAMLGATFEGPIRVVDWLDLVRWGTSAFLGMGGWLYAIAVFGELALRKEVDKNRRRASTFGPNIEDFLDTCNRWPKPVELEAGKRYRYMDPEGVQNAIKEKITAIYVAFGLILALAALFAFIPFFIPQPKGFWGQAVGLFVGLAAIGLGLLTLNGPYRRKLNFVDDVVWIDGDLLVVQRGTETFTYPAKPMKAMKDEPAKKEVRYPFGKTEKHGIKPDIYELDRRYLMEIPDDLGLPSQHVVSDGVQHISG